MDETAGKRTASSTHGSPISFLVQCLSAGEVAPGWSSLAFVPLDFGRGPPIATTKRRMRGNNANLILAGLRVANGFASELLTFRERRAHPKIWAELKRLRQEMRSQVEARY